MSTETLGSCTARVALEAKNRAAAITATARTGNRNVTRFIINSLRYGRQAARWTHGTLPLFLRERGTCVKARAELPNETNWVMFPPGISQTVRSTFQRSVLVHSWMRVGSQEHPRLKTEVIFEMSSVSMKLGGACGGSGARSKRTGAAAGTASPKLLVRSARSRVSEKPLLLVSDGQASVPQWAVGLVPM